MTEAPAAVAADRSALREGLVIACAILAVALPFLNGVAAGAPAPNASLDLRYVLVVGSAALGLLATLALRASALPPVRRRIRSAIALVLVVPIALALASPHDAMQVSAVTVEVLLLGPILVIGALFRLATDRALPLAARVSIPIVLSALLLVPWLTLAYGLSSVQLSILPARMAHQSPLLNAGEDEVELETRDGLTIRGTYTPGRRNRPGVVVLHGISDGRTRMAGWSALLAENGFHVLRFDWRAHGRSEGSVTTFGERERLDLDAAFEWLASQPGVDPDRMLLLGTSLGAGIALASVPDLAPRNLRGVVAFAPVSDLPALVEERIALMGPLVPVVRAIIGGVSAGLGHTSPLEQSQSQRYVEGTTDSPVPVLVFHGDADRTIPLGHSRALAAMSRHVELHEMPGVTHDSTPAAVLNDLEGRQRVVQFLRWPRALSGGSAPGPRARRPGDPLEMEETEE